MQKSAKKCKKVQKSDPKCAKKHEKQVKSKKVKVKSEEPLRGLVLTRISQMKLCKGKELGSSGNNVPFPKYRL